MRRIGVIAGVLLALSNMSSAASASDLLAAVLPSSRSTVVNQPTTVFATLINLSGHQADGCAIATSQSGVTLSYQPTNPATNRPQGPVNTPVTISTGGSQSFVLTITSSVVLTAVDLPLSFTCTNTQPAPIISGLDTLLLNVSASPVADIVALVATVTNDGVLQMASENDAKAFAVASINLGPDAQITVQPDLGDFSMLPVVLSICQTDKNGACIGSPTPSVTLDFPNGATPTFAVFAQVNGPIPFAPDAIRISVLFTDAQGVLRGRTSVALKTPTQPHPGSTPGGIYVGTWRITSSPLQPQPIAAMVSEDGEFHLLPGSLATDPENPTPIMRETLSLSVSDNLTFTATGNSYAAGTGVTAVTGNVTATGIFSPHQTLVLEYQNGSETGTFHLNYVARFYERETPLAVTAGTWNLRDEALNLIGSVKVAHDGTFAGMTSGGCALSGTISLIDMSFDVLRMSMNTSACGGNLAATFNGLAAFQHSVPRKELVDDASKELAIGNPQQIADEEADENQPADKEMIIELSNPRQAVAEFLTQK
jgi:hypothetical protein